MKKLLERKIQFFKYRHISEKIIQKKKIEASDYRNRLLKCGYCDRRSEASPVLPCGFLTARYMFCYPNYGKQDIISRKFYSNPVIKNAYMDLKSVLMLDPYDIYSTVSCFCSTHKPAVSELEICSVWKRCEFEMLSKLRYIILMGNASVRQFFGYGFKSLSKSSGTIIKTNYGRKELICLVLHHPWYFFMNRDGIKTQVLQSIRDFKSYIDIYEFNKR
jgi:uracil-DNA glycosylase